MLMSDIKINNTHKQTHTSFTLVEQISLFKTILLICSASVTIYKVHCRDIAIS